MPILADNTIRLCIAWLRFSEWICLVFESGFVPVEAYFEHSSII